MRSHKQLTYSFLLIIGVLVLINILANTFFLRIDLTEDRRYTLSKATKNILKELKEPVTVTAYFSKNLPTELMKGYRDFKEILVEYSNVSKHKVVFEFVNPAENEQTEQKAMQAGVQPVMVNVREKDEMKQQKLFIGAVVKLGERSEIIPVIQPGAAMEYALSAAIKKLSVVEKPSIGLLQGQGEPSLSAIHQAYSALGVLYNVELAYLTDTTYTLNKYKTLAIIDPKNIISEKYLQQLDRFLSEGGNIFIATSHVNADFKNLSGNVVNNGIEVWLKKKGLTINDNLAIDANCGQVSVQQNQGSFVMSSQIKFPYFPIISKFPKHPITEGIDAVILPFASTLTFSNNSNLNFIPLAQTSEKSGTRPTPVTFEINKEWSESDFPLKDLTLAAALVPKDSKGGKIIVVSNGSFATNGEAQQQEQQQQVNTGNLNLMVNSIDWLSDETGLINLRAKGIKVRPLDQIEDGKKIFLKYLNFLLPILLIIGYGIYRMNRNRNKRLKRMEANYV
jgi:gliding-associated putative ABC transporter substrate-binding component GldG